MVLSLAAHCTYMADPAVLQIGTAIGSYEAGMACMAVFQMVLYALVMGYATSMIWRMTAEKMAGGGNNTISGAFPIQHGFSGVYHKGYLVYHIVYVVLFTFSGEKLFQQRKKENPHEHSSGG